MCNGQTVHVATQIRHSSVCSESDDSGRVVGNPYFGVISGLAHRSGGISAIPRPFLLLLQIDMLDVLNFPPEKSRAEPAEFLYRISCEELNSR